MIFKSRQDAGKQLARRLRRYQNADTVVLGLPRGGVVVAAEIARELHTPLGVIPVRKIGHPLYPEYAIGAVADDIDPVLNATETAAIEEDWLQGAIEAAMQMNAKRRRLYYKTVMPPEITGKTVLLVDDGAATGMTMKAAAQAVRLENPRQIIAVVPVVSPEAVAVLEHIADALVTGDDPRRFLNGVGEHYREFEQVTDEEVITLLREVQHDIQQTSAGDP